MRSLSPAFGSGRRAVIFIGDSITAGWPLQNYWTNALNAGVGGDTSVQMCARFAVDVLARRPASVHILAGTNDVRHGSTDVSYVASMALAAVATGIIVVLAKIPPQAVNTNVTAFNANLVAMAAARGLPVADYFSPLTIGGAQDTALFLDQPEILHPNATGYQKMRQAVWPIL